jgi:hypothetical protein
VYLKKCCLNYNDGVFHPFQDGIIYKIFSDIIFVAKRNGSLLIECVLDEQDNDIKQNLQLGDRFYTPMEFLQSAKESRILYTPAGIKTINPHNKDK